MWKFLCPCGGKPVRLVPIFQHLAFLDDTNFQFPRPQLHYRFLRVTKQKLTIPIVSELGQDSQIMQFIGLLTFL